MNYTSNAPDRAPFLERCFLFEAAECCYSLDSISGEIPAWLQGSYYVNGPARFERGGQRYNHWLDGDGMVCALRFEDDSVRFASRFIRTRKLREEDAAGRFLYRAFGTRFPGDRLRRGLMLEPPVNVSVYPHAGRILAFGEQSLPHELDPVSLETRGEYDFNGRLTEVSPFSAHPKHDPATGNLVNFGVSFSATRPALNVYEFDSRGALLSRSRHPLRRPHSNHDFGLSPNFAVFYISPLLMDFERFFSENLSVVESLSWEPEMGSRILIASRGSGSVPSFEVEVGSGNCLHLINCFERAENTLVVDVLELEEPVYPEYQPMPDLFQGLTRCRPVRYELHIPSESLVEKHVMDYDRGPDFPSLDRRLLGRPYEDFWVLGISAAGKPGRKFFDQLARGNWKVGAVADCYQTEPGHYLAGEPVHIRNPGDPEEAVILVEHLDAVSDRAEFLLFEARNIAQGPLARLPLRHKIHPGFHACFVPA